MKKVLVIDDNKSICDILAKVLKEEVKCKVNCCYSFFGLPKDFKPDLIISDYHLDVGKTAKNVSDSFSGVPLVAITGDSDSEIVAWAKSRGVPLFEKPICYAEFLVKVKEMLKE